MRLKDWAKSQGIHCRTAWRWFHAGRLPVPALQTASGAILVQTPTSSDDGAALYARVSSHDQRGDLDRQVARLSRHAAERGLKVLRVETEVGSALNGKRPRLTGLLGDARARTIVVEHRDRLSRFGFEYIAAALAAQGRRIEVIDEAEVEDDLVRDMLEVLTSFCTRLYGRRGARHRARAALEAANQS